MKTKIALAAASGSALTAAGMFIGMSVILGNALDRR